MGRTHRPLVLCPTMRTVDTAIVSRTCTCRAGISWPPAHLLPVVLADGLASTWLFVTYLHRRRLGHYHLSEHWNGPIPLGSSATFTLRTSREVILPSNRSIGRHVSRGPYHRPLSLILPIGGVWQLLLTTRSMLRVMLNIMTGALCITLRFTKFMSVTKISEPAEILCSPYYRIEF